MTTVSIGKYHPLNVPTGTATLYYVLQNKLVGYRVNSTVSTGMRYLHQDHQGSTSIVAEASGDAVPGANVPRHHGASRGSAVAYE